MIRPLLGSVLFVLIANSASAAEWSPGESFALTEPNPTKYERIPDADSRTVATWKEKNGGLVFTVVKAPNPKNEAFIAQVVFNAMAKGMQGGRVLESSVRKISGVDIPSFTVSGNVEDGELFSTGLAIRGDRAYYFVSVVSVNEDPRINGDATAFLNSVRLIAPQNPMTPSSGPNSGADNDKLDATARVSRLLGGVAFFVLLVAGILVGVRYFAKPKKSKPKPKKRVRPISEEDEDEE